MQIFADLSYLSAFISANLRPIKCYFMPVGSILYARWQYNGRMSAVNRGQVVKF